MHDVRVIAIDQRTETKAGEPVVVAHTATLEVSPKQSEIIALASEIGKLSLSLRSLVPAASDAAVSESDAPDSPGAAPEPTVTLDSEVSPLLPKPLSADGKQPVADVTILRGSGKASESVALPGALPASPQANPAPTGAGQAAQPVSRGS